MTLKFIFLDFFNAALLWIEVFGYAHALKTKN